MTPNVANFPSEAVDNSIHLEARITEGQYHIQQLISTSIMGESPRPSPPSVPSSEVDECEIGMTQEPAPHETNTPYQVSHTVQSYSLSHGQLTDHNVSLQSFTGTDDILLQQTSKWFPIVCLIDQIVSPLTSAGTSDYATQSPLLLHGPMVYNPVA
ncbi:hypothetical protein ACTXT7_015714 [Hymenolepis weldensis]